MRRYQNLADAYAAGKADAARSSDQSLDATKVLAGFLSGGATTLVTGVTTTHYNPPRDETERIAYDQGWND
jgi:hypothetical protein